MLNCLVGAVLGLVPTLAASLQANTLIATTDTSWRAIGPVGNLETQNITNVGLGWESSNAGWNTSLGYDDSDAAGWISAVFNGHPNIPNSIWSSDDHLTGPTPTYFRKEITINGTPTTGSFAFIVDDDVQLYVNGNLVFNDTNGLATFATGGINITASLISGVNLIAMKVHDQQGAEGIGGTITISYVPEPSTLLLALVGLSLATMFRRRRK